MPRPRRQRDSRFVLYRDGLHCTECDWQWRNDGDDSNIPASCGACGSTVADGFQVRLPTKKEVCPDCEGEGRVVNPSIGAITASQWRDEWDEESREMYLSGGYDVQCRTCNGLNVVDVVDRDRCEKADLEEWDHQEAEREACDSMQRAEARMEHFAACRFAGSYDYW